MIASINSLMSGSYASAAAAASSLTITVTAPQSLRDLCNEYAVLTGNNVGVVRPNVGPSKFVDALMQLATGSDAALAVAARDLLPRICSDGSCGPDGQANVCYQSDRVPVFNAKELPEAEATMQAQDWSDRAISNIASAMAQGAQPNEYDIAFLHAKLYGSATVIDTEAMAAGEVATQYNAGRNGSFYSAFFEGCLSGQHVILDGGAQALKRFYAAAAPQAKYEEF